MCSWSFKSIYNFARPQLIVAVQCAVQCASQFNGTVSIAGTEHLNQSQWCFLTEINFIVGRHYQLFLLTKQKAIFFNHFSDDPIDLRQRTCPLWWEVSRFTHNIKRYIFFLFPLKADIDSSLVSFCCTEIRLCGEWICPVIWKIEK